MATKRYLAWTDEAPSNADLDTRLAQRGINVKDAPYNAKGDGVTDDTAAFVAAYNALGALGGKIFVPQSTGLYRVNLTITKPNVSIVGSGGTTGSSISVGLIPADPALPVITVGDGTTQCLGLSLKNIQLSGRGTGSYGLKINGASNCTYENFASTGFTVYNVLITSNANANTAYQFFSNFAIEAGAGGIGLDMLYGATYTTAIYFTNGHLSGSTTGASARSDGCDVHFSNMWVNVNASGFGLSSLNSGKFLMQNVEIDSNNSADVLLTADQDALVSTLFRGMFTVDGVMQTTAGNTAYLGNVGHFLKENYLTTPYVQNGIIFTDALLAPHLQSDTADQTVYIKRLGTKLVVPCPLDLNIQLELENGLSALVGASHSAIYGTSGAGGAYPFNQAGHLVLEPRTSGTNRDVVIAGTSRLMWVTDNVGDIGSPGANRPKNFYLAGIATIGGAFGCNGATARAALASGGALSIYAAGANGLSAAADMAALVALVANVRLALVNNGIMS